ncbi:MAG: DUF4167 domain-containing protein [Pseudomonadota bacterium]|nr:DUF4167 domain-containing protein [Pseudomonadota bacterium]
MINRRKNFRSRSQKNSFRRRNSTINTSSANNFNNNGNVGFVRNGSMNNIFSVEKAMQKFQQLAKDAQSNGDPVLAQNYLQHADHYLRRYNELNDKKANFSEKNKISDNSLTKVENKNEDDINQSTNQS